MIYIIGIIAILIIINLYVKINRLNRAVVALANAIDKKSADHEDRLHQIETEGDSDKGDSIDYTV